MIMKVGRTFACTNED